MPILEIWDGRGTNPVDGADCTITNTFATARVSAGQQKFNTVARLGATGFGVQITVPTAVAGYLEFPLVGATGNRLVVMVENVKLDAQTNTGDLRWLSFYNTGTTLGHGCFNSVGAVSFRDSAGAFNAAAPAPAGLGSTNWDVEMAITAGTTLTDGVMEFRYYPVGSNVVTFSRRVEGLNTNTLVANTIRFGSSNAVTGGITYSADTISYAYLATGWMRISTNAVPVVTPAAAITNAQPGSTVTTSVTATDSDGTIASYAATAPGLTLTGTGNSRTFVAPSNAAAQTYTVTWTVTDNGGAVTTATQSITVLAYTAPIGSETVLEIWDGRGTFPVEGADVSTANTFATALALTVDTTVKFRTAARLGTTGFGAQVVNTGIALGYIEFPLTGATGNRLVVLAENVKIDALTNSGDLRWLTFRNGTSTIGHACFSSTGAMSLRDSAGAFNAANAAPAALGSSNWDIEVAFTAGTTITDGVMEFRYYPVGSNSLTFARTLTGVNTNTLVANAIRFGATSIVAGGITYSVDTLRYAYLASGWIKTPTNISPAVTPAAAITNAEPGSTVTTSVTATDSDGTIASYAATAPGLTLVGTGALRTFRAPLSLTSQLYTVTWTVTDSGGAVTTATQNITVLACTLRVAQAGVQVPAVWRAAL